MKPNRPIDPLRELSARTREGTKALRELYLGMIREGFTEDEAMKFIAECVARQGRQR